MLGAVLREVRSSFGDAAVREIFEGVGRRQGDLLRQRTEHADLRERAEAVARTLRDGGVEAELVQIGDTLELREHNCPYAKTVAEHPEVCGAIHTMMDRVLPGASVAQVESLATGGSSCRFDIRENRSKGTSP